MDFTICIYRKLLDQLLKAGYAFQTFSEFIEKPKDRVILLRHDVDAKKLNSLKFAEIQQNLGIKGTYYFRIVPQSFDEDVIRRIADMGHEIGYHYEDMDFAYRRQRAKGKESRVKSQETRGQSKEHRALDENELLDDALVIFKENLEKLRKIYPVKTICMHGSPRSPIDNKALWEKYNYRDFGIIGEPYFDIDFNDVFYLTDTGRRWDGEKVSVRDKVSSSEFRVQGSELNFHSTNEIIAAAKRLELPDRIMFTFHPQRWTNSPLPWLWELVFQNSKNLVKGYIVKQRMNVQKNNVINP